MPVFEKIKSLICAPTDKCCEILCSKCKKHSKKKRRREVRRHTGWDPASQKLTIDDFDDEDDDDDDLKPAPEAWRSKKSVVALPLMMKSYGTDIEQVLSDNDKPIRKKRSYKKSVTIGTDFKRQGSIVSDKPIETKWRNKPVTFPLMISSTGINIDPVTSKWANKDAAIYSAVITDRPQRRYWVERNLKYVIMLPEHRQHGTTQETQSDIDSSPPAPPNSPRISPSPEEPPPPPPPPPLPTPVTTTTPETAAEKVSQPSPPPPQAASVSQSIDSDNDSIGSFDLDLRLRDDIDSFSSDSYSEDSAKTEKKAKKDAKNK